MILLISSSSDLCTKQVDVGDSVSMLSELRKLELVKVFCKVKWMISWLEFHAAIHKAILSYKWLDTMTFQTKCWSKSSIFFPKKPFYPIKTLIGHWTKFLFFLEKCLFFNHYYPCTKSEFYFLDVVFRQNEYTFSKEHFLKCLAKYHL